MTALVGLVPLYAIASLAALAFVWKKSSKARLRCLAAVVGGFLLLTWPPVAWIAAYTLERGLSSGAPEGDAEAIVVLSGFYESAKKPSRPFAFLGSDTYVRTKHAAWLHSAWRPLPVVVCGGMFHPGDTEGGAAPLMKAQLVGDGVPADRVWLEDRSTSTRENALFAAEFLRERGIKRVALVTDAAHMPRAKRCFENVGLDVVPAPCRGITTAFGMSFDFFVPSVHALGAEERVFHEYVGLVWYWLRGWL